MRHVARRAAFDLNGFMLIHKWPGFVRVTREANQVLRPCGPQLVGLESAMRIMAIRAFHQSFVHLVMKGPIEILLLVEMAAIAKSWLAYLQEFLTLFWMMGVVAVDTANAVLEVDGTGEIAMFLSILVTAKAAGAGLLR